MQPTIVRSGWLALYLGLWLLLGGLLTLLLIASSSLTWLQAIVVALPMASAYAFVCLSSWYVARSLPLATTGPTRLLVTGVVTATLSSAILAGACRAPDLRPRAAPPARRPLRQPRGSRPRLRRAGSFASLAISYRC